MPGLRVRGRHGDCLLVPAREIREVSDPGVARVLARRVTEAVGYEGPSEDELVEGLLSGALLLMQVDGPPRPLDEPRVRELSSLAEPLDGMPEPARTRSWVGVEIVDPRGRALPFFSLHLEDPAGMHHEARLDAAARARVDGLDDDGSCTITLSPVEQTKR